MKAADIAAGTVSVVHYQGEHVTKLRSSWKSVSGGAQDGPHVLRHTAATWLMQARVDVFEAAGYLGMTVERAPSPELSGEGGNFRKSPASESQISRFIAGTEGRGGGAS